MGSVGVGDFLQPCSVPPLEPGGHSLVIEREVSLGSLAH